MHSMSLKFATLSCIIIFWFCSSGLGERIEPGQTLADHSVSDLSAKGNIRNVVVEITNHLDVPLNGGEHYINWGYTRTTVHSIIQPHTRDAFLVDSAPGTATGAAGLVSYTIPDEKEDVRFIIAFSVPFDYIYSSNWFGLKKISKGEDVNRKLFMSVYYDKAWRGPTQRHYGYAYNGRHVELNYGDYRITASMTNLGRSVVGVDVYYKGGRNSNGSKVLPN